MSTDDDFGGTPMYNAKLQHNHIRLQTSQMPYTYRSVLVQLEKVLIDGEVGKPITLVDCSSLYGTIACGSPIARTVNQIKTHYT